MRRLILCLCLVSCLALPYAPAQAVYMTGEELVRSCDGSTPKELYSCTSYIAGMVDYHVLMQSLGTAPTLPFCLPSEAPIEQVAMYVLSELKKETHHGDFIATPAVALALNKLYPCQGQKTSRTVER